MKPRHTKRTILPVTAVAGDEVLSEAGELLSLSELVETLPKWPSTIFATVGAADLLAVFDDIYAASHPTSWQWRVGDNQRRVYRTHPNPKTRRTGRVEVAISFFGFKNHCFHKLIDPVTMYGHRLSKICPGDEPEIVRILRWAVTLRDFCAANNLDVRPTMGGISSQLLTDPRFYPNARRKVPAQTNQRARENLPGNHYRLNVIPSPHRDYRAVYLDQRRAHHYHAKLLSFPHADHLYAYGDFCNLTRIWRDNVSPWFMGLYYLDLQEPCRGKHYSWLPRGGGPAFVYTNELSHLLDMGYVVNGVYAGWGSTHRDIGLNRLAAWCCDQLDEYGNPRWLKPLLLSTYGTLACRPTDAEAVFRLAKTSKMRTVLTGRRSVTGKATVRPMKLEPGFVNVIQRGMIEAATRSESVGFAQHLEWQGQRVLAIYADAVIVEDDDDRPLPALFEPWEVKRTLNHYQPINMQAFISDGMTRLPGVSGELREYQQHTAPGHAPRVVQYEVLSGRRIVTGRRI
jgi:hypothetical protein